MIYRFVNSILVLIILLCIPIIGTALAQERSWQRVAPVGHSFTISMPTRAVEAFRWIPTAQGSIPVRVYYSLDGGKRFVLAAFFRTNPDSVPALSSYERFLTTIEQSFKGGEIAKSLTFDRDVSLHGVTGKQYRVKLAEYPGVARFLATEEAFYALMVIGAEESDSDVARFLSSFELGAVNTNAQASGVSGSLVTIVGSASDAPDRSNAPPPAERPGIAPPTEHPEVTLPPEPWPLPVGPITGGVLNGRAISLPVPEYPKAARKAHEAGIVSVQILIDEQGYVISAEALDGPSSLRDAAVKAAWNARFTPTRLMGQPVRVKGRILYNFVR